MLKKEVIEEVIDTHSELTNDEYFCEQSSSIRLHLLSKIFQALLGLVRQDGIGFVAPGEHK